MNEIAALTIKRPVIELNNTVAIERYFKQLTSSGRSAHQSVVMIFEGYDDTTEQIYEIKAVRNWVYSLFRLCPHFLYFINHQIDTHITLLACLGDIETLVVGSNPLTPKEYDDLGVDILSDTPKISYSITINDDLFEAIRYSLLKYGRDIDDPLGVELTIEMIRGVTNRLE